ncbi:xanthine dehydrogenase family protein subunit M [Flavobacterium sp. SORGH_AS_0622]|uniref:FAD binding domain-containing protein n=1 Tax=Flavobacterium sp. SORGH_AS_0622 TaxID=3041772 RepID=UPI00277EAEF8|nr:xanthine dehydrogenase family protein subunit M [Flavobacterium sp. SORGH_AS_0622]MDQ1165637.1 xanthine dehydrogenase YagS FAD-binding subunit [Flavobacterium sp. SORGH_AS_0622]
MNSFTYTKEFTVDAALKAADDEKAMFLAGGTNIIDLWKYNLTHPEKLIDINDIAALNTIEVLENNGVRLGALVKNAATAYDPLIEKWYPLLSKAILAGASAQIRNMATDGGNLLQRTRCYYFYDPDVPCNKRIPGSGCPAIEGCNRIHAVLGASEQCIAVFPSDMCVALAALEAVVNVTGPDGKRSIAFADFHRLPGDTPHLDNNLQQGEIITSIDLPPNHYSKHYAYLKLRDRHSYAFALVSVAAAFEMHGNTISKARIALGGVAHKPWRVAEAEDLLKGKKAASENFALAADRILAGAAGRGDNDFKIPLAKRAIIRACEMALNPETQIPGAGPSI